MIFKICQIYKYDKICELNLKTLGRASLDSNINKFHITFWKFKLTSEWSFSMQNK